MHTEVWGEGACLPPPLSTLHIKAVLGEPRARSLLWGLTTSASPVLEPWAGYHHTTHSVSKAVLGTWTPGLAFAQEAHYLLSHLPNLIHSFIHLKRHPSNCFLRQAVWKINFVKNFLVGGVGVGLGGVQEGPWPVQGGQEYLCWVFSLHLLLHGSRGWNSHPKACKASAFAHWSRLTGPILKQFRIWKYLHPVFPVTGCLIVRRWTESVSPELWKPHLSLWGTSSLFKCCRNCQRDRRQMTAHFNLHFKWAVWSIFWLSPLGSLCFILSPALKKAPKISLPVPSKEKPHCKFLMFNVEMRGIV